MDPNFQGDFQASQGFQGDFSDGTQMLLPIDFDVDWSLWMDMDAMNAMEPGHGLGMMDDWGAESNIIPPPQITSQLGQINAGHSADQPQQTLSYQQNITFQPLSLWNQHGDGADEFRQQLGSDLSPSTLVASPMSIDGNGPPSMSNDRQLASMCNFSQADNPTIHSSIASVSLTNKRPKVPKSRIRCSHPGCKLTFPRKYELQRHQDGVHNSKVAVFCPFYECDRAVKPYPRKDKAWEHMRKHRNEQQFVCIFESCRSGPWSQEELLCHLNSQHSQERCCAESEAIVLGFFQWRQTPLRDGLFLFESKDNCPLAFLGCEFKVGDKRIREHLESHELIDRSKGFEAIRAVVDDYCFPWGTATCPICREQVCDPDDYISRFANHLGDHSKEERAVHPFELAEIFRPFISQQRPWDRPNFGIMIEAELQEAGVIPKTMG
ncbi:hypothetical protein BKA61DRAFT_582047 [Leptodontidium sp. MPI-SDFR-AT-0119]|nr:hypothetical protein BKA61DRAFT_582047 [Leptodontidium sp. MPI-SDFR-AT-0119]